MEPDDLPDLLRLWSPAEAGISLGAHESVSHVAT
jgi:hypothetical protein